LSACYVFYLPKRVKFPWPLEILPELPLYVPALHAIADGVKGEAARLKLLGGRSAPARGRHDSFRSTSKVFSFAGRELSTRSPRTTSASFIIPDAQPVQTFQSKVLVWTLHSRGDFRKRFHNRTCFPFQLDIQLLRTAIPRREQSFFSILSVLFQSFPALKSLAVQSGDCGKKGRALWLQ